MTNLDDNEYLREFTPSQANNHYLWQMTKIGVAAFVMIHPTIWGLEPWFSGFEGMGEVYSNGMGLLKTLLGTSAGVAEALLLIAGGYAQRLHSKNPEKYFKLFHNAIVKDEK